MINLNGTKQDVFINSLIANVVRACLDSQANAGQKNLSIFGYNDTKESGTEAISQTTMENYQLIPTGGVYSNWQSFTTPNTYYGYKGPSITIKLYNPNGSYPYFAFKITDMAGNQIGAEKQVNANPYQVDLTVTWAESELQLLGNTQYKLWVKRRSDDPYTGSPAYWQYTNTNPYSGGRSDINANYDYGFVINFTNCYLSRVGSYRVGEQIVIYDGDNAFETGLIDSKNNLTGVLTLTQNLVNTYVEGSFVGKYFGYLDTANQKYQRLLSPDLGTGADGAYNSAGDVTWNTDKNFTSITVNSGHTVIIDGNVQIKCQGAITINAGGKISAKGKGHAGGYGGGYNGQQGTSYAGSPTTSLSPNYGGGGGGQSNPGGGGGGAYSTNGTGASGSNAGQGGIAYNVAELNANFAMEYLKGSGGGGASISGGTAPSGGYGGGIIRLHCKDFVNYGEVDCDGNNGGSATQSGSQCGGAGGGAGGTIYIQALRKCILGTNTIHAKGGSYGESWPAGNYRGGSGGDGRIRVECPGKLVGQTNPVYSNGYNSNVGGYTKYGWYFTKELQTSNPSITVVVNVKQKAIEKKALSSSASAGQANVIIADASKFSADDKVLIYENGKQEIREILSINSNTLTLKTNLDNSYTTSAYVYRIDVYAGATILSQSGTDNLVEMPIKEINVLANDILYVAFIQTVKTTASQLDGYKLIGYIRLKGKTADTQDVHLKEANWTYF